MKVLLKTAIVVALLNLLAVLGALGWLAATDRMSKDRALRMGDLFAPTVAQEKQALALEQAKNEADSAAVAAAAKMAELPKSAAATIDDRRQLGEISQQASMRLRDELRLLQAQLERRQGELDAATLALDAKEKTYQQRLVEMGKAASTAQFKQALAALEAQEPPDAQKVLAALIQTGRRDQAISYLASMNPRARASIVTEFITADERLAADLLEELRTRGLAPGGPSSTQATQTR